MACRANRRWKTCRDVIRYRPTQRRRALPSSLVAAVAVRVRRRERVVVPHVAVGAGHHFPCRRHLVRARQCPTGRAVIEGCRVPGNGVMARRAVRGRKRRSGRRVRRIIGLLPGRQVAA